MNDEPEVNERGNMVLRGQDFGGDRYKYDFNILKDWEQYDTDQDASYFGVWVNIEKRHIFTYAEGDTTLVTCPNIDTFKAELADMARFYGDPPPAFISYSNDWVRTEHYDTRPTL